MLLRTCFSASSTSPSTDTSPSSLTFLPKFSNCSSWNGLFVNVVNESTIFDITEKPSPKLDIEIKLVLVQKFRMEAMKIYRTCRLVLTRHIFHQCLTLKSQKQSHSQQCSWPPKRRHGRRLAYGCLTSTKWSC